MPLMSATDDAPPLLSSEPPRHLIRAAGAARSSPLFASALPLYGALAGTLLACALLATPGLLPQLPRYAARVGAAPAGASQEWRGVDLASLRERVRREASPAEAEADAARARLERRRHEWRASPAGPLAPLAPAAECAARLHARAELAVVLAGEDASPGLDPAGHDLSSAARRLEDADRAVELAALALDPDRLREALRAADLAEGAWLAGSSSDARVRLARWRGRERDRGEQFTLAAREIEPLLTPFQRELIPLREPEIALENGSTALATLDAAAVGETPSVRPIAGVWGCGALIGLALGAGGGLFARRRTRPDPASPRARARRTDSAPPLIGWSALRETAWLHAVIASERSAVARALREVAGEFLARDERVLIVDTGRRFALHRSFDGASQWGLDACLSGALPLLGAVQHAGEPGLYLLARGTHTEESLDSIGRVVDEARRHFARVIVAVEADAPPGLLAALRQRAARECRVGFATRPSAAPKTISDRAGILFMHWPLPGPSHPSLEALRRRLEASRAAFPTPVIPAAGSLTPVVSEADPAAGGLVATVSEADRTASAIGDTAALPGPTVECDAQTRERLRFLMWMRRVQSERRTRVADPSPRLTTAGP